MSLKHRIALTVIGCVALALAAAVWVSLSHSLRALQEQAGNTEQNRLLAAGASSRAALLSDDEAEIAAVVDRALLDPGIEAMLIADAEDQVVAASEGGFGGRPYQDLTGASQWRWRTIRVQGQSGEIGTVAIAFSNAVLEAARRRALMLGAVIIGGGVLAAAVLALGAGHVLTRRLRTLADAAENTGTSDTGIPFAGQGTDEVSRVARAFDGMLRRLKESMAALTEAHDLLSEPTEAMSQGFVLWDADDRLVLCNSCFRTLFQVAGDHIATGIPFGELILHLRKHITNVEGDALTVRDWLKRRRDGILSARFTVDICLQSHRWIRVAESRTRDGGRVAICTDITTERNQRRALHASDQRLRQIMASVFDGIITVDENGLIDGVNEAAQRMFRRSPLDMLGKPVSEFLVGHARLDDGTVQPKGLSAEDLSASPMQALREIGGKRKGDENFPVEISVARMELHGSTTFICTVRDITERKAAEREILFHATHDTLTGLPNRTLFDDRLNNALSHAKRSGETLSLVFLDVDRFKTINDMLGHPVGDAVLVAVARRLLDQLRESDTVARLGGDEFILLLRDVGNSRNAAAIGQGIVDAMRLPFQVLGHDLHVTVSLGVSTFPQDGETADQLRKHADVALYRAKSDGRNCVRLFLPGMNIARERELTIESDLRRALARNQLRLRYQPIVDLHSGRLTGVEALVRWQHPELGLIAASQFIPFAEVSGLITSIGHWVLQSACQQMQQWRTLSQQPLRLGVNLSARQFQERSLSHQIAAILQETGIDPNLLEFEVNETVLAQDSGIVAAQASAIAASGAGLVVDNSGADCTLLGQLVQLPLKGIKIGRHLIEDIEHRKDGVPMVEAAVVMMHGLGLRVVAGGIESIAQAEIVRGCGCDEGQGFLTGQPVGAEEIGVILKS